MDFSLTEEQAQLRRSVREFAEGEISPHVMEWDEASHFPSEMIPKLAEMGLAGRDFPGEIRRRGAGLRRIRDRDRGIVAGGRLGRNDRRGAQFALLAITFTNLAPRRRRRNICRIWRRGKRLGCWSLTEPEAGSDAGGTRTRRSRKTAAG